MVMQTTCGGHLGWHEAPPTGGWGGSSWADTAMVDFIQAVLDTQNEMQQNVRKYHKSAADKTQQERHERAAQRRVAQNTEFFSRL